MICTSCNTGTIRELGVVAGNGMMVVCDHPECRKCFVAEKTKDDQAPVLTEYERMTGMIAKRYTNLNDFVEDMKAFPVYE